MSSEGASSGLTEGAVLGVAGVCACSDFSSAQSDAAAAAQACAAAGDGKSCAWVSGTSHGGVCTGVYSCAKTPLATPADASVCTSADECARRAKDMIQQRQAAGEHLQQDHAPLALYARAVALEPKDASLHNDYGVALGQHGRWAEAGERFQAALALREEQLASMLAAGNTPDERLDKLRRKVQRVKQNLQYAQQGVLASRAEL